MEWISLKSLVEQTGISQARLVRAGKSGELVDGKSILMRGSGQDIEWAIVEPATKKKNCLHCSAPPSKRTGKMCSVCNREALKKYQTPYKGPQYSAESPAPVEPFEVEGGQCDISCPVCTAVFMAVAPNDAEVLAAGPATCDCGAEFTVEWDGGAYLTTPTAKAIEGVVDPHAETEAAEEPIPTFGRVADDNVYVRSAAVETVDEKYLISHAPRVVQTHDHRVHPMLPSCRLLGKTEAHSDEWHANRARGIGSSDAGAILGLSPFATIQDAWATKVGVETDNKPWMEPYSDFGTFFEPHLRHAIRLDGVNLLDGEDIGTLQSLTWERALANVDGLDADTGDNWEIKTSSEEWGEVPPYYYAQVQEQMFVTGADRTILHQYIIPFDRKLIRPLIRHVGQLALMDVEAENVVAAWLLEIGTRKNWVVEYDADYVALMLERMREFWTFVENGEEPPTLEAEGTVDLTECDDLVGFLDQFVLEQARVPKDAIKAAGVFKSTARGLIDEALALRGVKAKRIVAGPHKATWVQPAGRAGHWTIYGGDDVSINW